MGLTPADLQRLGRWVVWVVCLGLLGLFLACWLGLVGCSVAEFSIVTVKIIKQPKEDAPPATEEGVEGASQLEMTDSELEVLEMLQGG